MTWSRPLAYVLVIGAIAGSYFITRLGRGDGDSDAGVTPVPDPGYAARDAVVIETGYDGRERYRLNAQVIRQHTEGGAIDLEKLSMDYHPDAQGKLPGETVADRGELWHLTSDRGQVRADGDDVQLAGGVAVRGTLPGGGAPVALRTEALRINTPTEFIETDAPVVLDWSGHEINAVGFEADLKGGHLRLRSEIHGKFSPK